MTAPVGRGQKSGLVPQASPTASALRERKVLLVSKGRPWPRTGQYPLRGNWPTSPFSLWRGGGGGRSETERLGGGGKMGIQRLGHSFSNRDVTDIPLSASAAGTINVATSLLFLFCWVSHALDLCKTIHSSSSDLYGFFKYRERGRGKTP